ncbi:hypothetical protein DNHGIG_17770 [Collibacillus ludicampi]|jgi:hypothetical protein|uniref:Uncharacterized protein n=1 Tax=Collibacillus ludicampi TaxID=2771369 RepID=A0AAV4LEX6_9BACL|nr:hypothetical protein [Collibacillus ludicampi]GIM46228.1 hypothetical protein DNHGIG_17770 [Collibacillus ludicampi]
MDKQKPLYTRRSLKKKRNDIQTWHDLTLSSSTQEMEAETGDSTFEALPETGTFLAGSDATYENFTSGE